MNKIKSILTFILAHIFICTSLMAQVPQSFEYQAVVRDASGNILASQAVGVQITLLHGSATGSNVYQESFSMLTNDYGLMNLQIGTGTTTGNFSAIDWTAGSYFVEVALDITGGSNYSVMGTSQLLSVPYALHAKTVEVNNACDLFSYYYADRDGDGYGDAYNLVFSCNQPVGYVTDNTDCSDNDSSSNPNAIEICDSIDNNCDGQIDEGITMITQYVDNDGDGYGDYTDSGTQVCFLQNGYSLTNDDCNDMDQHTYPGAIEVCNDGIDNDCNGLTDEGCGCANGTFRQCVITNSFGTCVGQEECVNGVWVNCSASTPSEEICDGIDNNCDGQIDEGFDFSSDSNNCSGCGIVCPQGTICEQGVCVTP